LSLKLPFFLLILMFVFIGCSKNSVHPNFFKNIELNQSKDFEASIMAMASNEKRNLIAIGYENGHVDIFEGNTATKYMSFAPNVLNIRSNILNFSNDGKYLTVGSNFDDGTYIYDMDNKSFLTQLHETRNNEVFTSDDKFLFLSDGDTLKIYDMVNQEWMETYIGEHHIESITLNKNNTQLALCRFDGIIELYSIKRSSWYEKVFQGFIPIKLTLLSKVKIPREEKCYIHDLWLQDNKLFTLSTYEKKEREGNVTIKTGQMFKTAFYHKDVKLDIWSLPNLSHITSIPLQIDSVRQAKMSKNEKNIIILGSKEKCGHYLETINLETNQSTIQSYLMTNISNIVPWLENAKNQENQVFFIEHNAHKMLYRSGESPVYNHNDKYQKEIQDYLNIPFYYKSFALAEDANGKYSYGFAYGGNNQISMDSSALAICYDEAQKRDIKSECHVIFQNDTAITFKPK
jgi:WD40 repeat protein